MSELARERAEAMVWMVVGAATIAAGAQISVPMVPVPTTLQTLALVYVALAAGPVVGAGAAGVYLVGVLVGLPILSDGEVHAGRAFLEMKSAGYVVGFLPAGVAVGWLGRREELAWLVTAGLAGHAIVLAIGVGVLATWLGAGAAIEHGLLPFLVGAAVKSLVPAGIVWGWRRRGAGVTER